jgi:Uma2 family endonuclease
MTLSYLTDIDLSLPDSDGKPMADNTEQFRWIVLIKENLEIQFAADPNVFIAGDLLWYPVRSRIVPPVAPDVMVVFGRPKGKRGSYRQWQEEGIAPQVVFEIRSPNNKDEEMDLKLEFYNTYGVEEYYLYDPDSNQLAGWLRQPEQLLAIAQMHQWVSPRLGIRFDLNQPELLIYRANGQRFLNSVELAERAEQEQQRAEQERQRAEQERQRAEIAETQLIAEQSRAEQLAQYLRSIGVDPDQLPEN